MADLTLETLLCEPLFFDLPATPVQRAIARASEGRPLGAEIAGNEDVIAAFGGTAAIAALPVGQIPLRVDVYSGIRTAKSLISSAAAICMLRRIDVSGTRESDLIRIPIMSLDMDKGSVVLQHLIGTIMARPALRSLMIGEPTGDSVFLRHKSGRPIEIRVVAGKRAGGALVAVWLGGVIFDEAPRMLGSEDGAIVNIDEAIAASAGRILPGGQTWVIGSPYAPWGECFESVRRCWGYPSQARIVVKAPAPVMNPVWWTPERVANIRENNPRAYKTDVCAEFADASSSALESSWVDAAIRRVPRFTPMSAPIGVLDSSAGKGDAFTWCAAQWIQTNPDVEYESDSETDPVYGFTSEILKLGPHGLPIKKPNQPKPELLLRVFGFGAIEGKFRQTLSWDQLLDHIARCFHIHGVRRAYGDQYQSWPMESGFSKRRLEYSAQNWSQTSKSESLGRVKNWFRDSQIIIDGGHENAAIRRELVQLEVRPTAAGGETIGARRGGHDDRAALFLNLGILDSTGSFTGSPVRRFAGVIIG